jgi:hypothetical protein
VEEAFIPKRDRIFSSGVEELKTVFPRLLARKSFIAVLASMLPAKETSRESSELDCTFPDDRDCA